MTVKMNNWGVRRINKLEVECNVISFYNIAKAIYQDHLQKPKTVPQHT